MSAAAGGLLALAPAAFAQEAPATFDRLKNADNEPANWLHPMQNYSAHRYSTLDEINKGNIDDLHVAFTVPMSQALIGLQRGNNMAAPLVDGGYMYASAVHGKVFKIDLTAGDHGVVMWVADAEVSPDESTRDRGGALYENSYVSALADGRVVRFDRSSGEIIWDSQIARVIDAGHSGIEPEAENFTSNPIVANGHIQVGNANGDGGTRGWVAAVNFETGDEEWRFYTVPGPGEPGHETWADAAGVSWRTGGAAIWTGWSYDVGQNLFIGGTAQPVPMFDPEYRPGDNLYSNSALALDADTGELKWYFQYTPNESWDYDEQGVHMLVDAPYQGQDRQTLVHWGRNGFVYQLDRTDGTFLNAKQYVSDITWTAGIDPKTGQPVEYDPNLDLQAYIPATRWARADAEPKRVCPVVGGGVRWQPPSYNRDTQVAFMGGEDGCQEHAIVPSITLENGQIDEQGRRRGGIRNDISEGGLLAALDVTTGEVLDTAITQYVNRAGVLTTAGGILMTATYDGTVRVFDQDTLDELWKFSTGIGIKAPPITFEVGGKQYFAIIAGERQDNSATELGVAGTGLMIYFFTI
jgi:alcohol dehydrogenase (cytochrome c)